MAEPYLSEIKLVPYNYAPKGWAICAGQLLPINQNQALFSLLGTYYGGDGRVNFALPDLRGFSVVGIGQGDGLSALNIGETVGVEHVTLTADQVAYHSHNLLVSSAAGTEVSPVGHYPAVSPSGMGYLDGRPNGRTMPANTVSKAGSLTPQAHDNRQPYLVLNYIIALVGIFPSRN